MAGVFIGAGVHGVVFWAAGVLVCPHDGWSLGFESSWLLDSVQESPLWLEFWLESCLEWYLTLGAWFGMQATSSQ